MVDSSSSWETFPLTALQDQIEITRDQGKYLIIHDKTGNVATFFRYKGYELPFHTEIVKTALGRQTVDDTVELFRKAFVNCLRNGEQLLIDCGHGGIDFASKYNKIHIFDTSVFFDFTESHRRENYLKIVKEEENFGPGGINPGCYIASSNFSMNFSTCAETEAEVNTWVATMPHHSKMRKIIIK